MGVFLITDGSRREALQLCLEPDLLNLIHGFAFDAPVEIPPRAT